MPAFRDKTIHIVFFEDEEKKRTEIRNRIETTYKSILGSDQFSHVIQTYSRGVTEAAIDLPNLSDKLVIQIWDLIFESPGNAQDAAEKHSASTANTNTNTNATEQRASIMNANAEEYLAAIIQQMRTRPHWRLIILATSKPTQDSLNDAIHDYNNSTTLEARKIHVLQRDKLHIFDKQLISEITFLMGIAWTGNNG